MLMERTTTGGTDRGNSGKASPPASSPCGRRCKASRRALSCSMSRRAAQQGRRRRRHAQIVQLQPDTLGIGHAQLREPEIERDQTIQAGQADGGVGAAQGAAQQLGDEPLAGRGLGDGERAGKQKADRAHRPRQHEADSADHVSRD